MEMPSFEAFDQTIDQLLQSLKYIKFNEWILNLAITILKEIFEFFKHLFVGNLPAASSISTQKVLLILIIAVIAVITFVYILLFLRNRNKHKKVRAILGEKIDKNSTVLSFVDKSIALEAEGAYRQAVRLRFIASLLHLHQNHLLYHDSSMTGQEMVAKLRKDQFKAVVSFEAMTQMFNTVWYGMEEIEKSKFEKWLEVENDFWKGVHI